MTRRVANRRPIVVPRLPVQSRASTTAVSTPCISAYPSDDEGATQVKSTAGPKFIFFLQLPSETRNQIYNEYFSDYFSAVPTLDLEPTTFRHIHRLRLLAIFSVSKQVHNEARHQFFSTQIVRVFPTYPGRHFKTKRPLLARLREDARACLTTLELRVGPGWNNPPQGWVVNDALGLADCTNVRTLKVFVECDPSDAIFGGFRKSEGFYEKFSAGLLDGILKAVPGIKVVEFDAYSSVKRNGDMMAGLGRVVSKHGKSVAWGPERGWALEGDQAWLDAILLHEGDQKLSKSAAVFA